MFALGSSLVAVLERSIATAFARMGLLTIPGSARIEAGLWQAEEDWA